MSWGDLFMSMVLTCLEPTNKWSGVAPLLMVSSLREFGLNGQWHLLYFEVVAHKNWKNLSIVKCGIINFFRWLWWENQGNWIIHMVYYILNELLCLSALLNMSSALTKEVFSVWKLSMILKYTLFLQRCVSETWISFKTILKMQWKIRELSFTQKLGLKMPIHSCLHSLVIMLQPLCDT